MNRGVEEGGTHNYLPLLQQLSKARVAQGTLVFLLVVMVVSRGIILAVIIMSGGGGSSIGYLAAAGSNKISLLL